MIINSLPPAEIQPVENRLISWYLGGGYIKSTNQNYPNALSITGGVGFKNHNLLVNASSIGQVGLSYVYRFNYKKKNR
jgi:hypothetical protein